MKNMIGKKISEVFQATNIDVQGRRYQVYFQYDHWSGSHEKTYFVVRESDRIIVFQSEDGDEAERKRSEFSQTHCGCGAEVEKVYYDEEYKSNIYVCPECDDQFIKDEFNCLKSIR